MSSLCINIYCYEGSNDNDQWNTRGRVFSASNQRKCGTATIIITSHVDSKTCSTRKCCCIYTSCSSGWLQWLVHWCLLLRSCLLQVPLCRCFLYRCLLMEGSGQNSNYFQHKQEDFYWNWTKKNVMGILILTVGHKWHLVESFLSAVAFFSFLWWRPELVPVVCRCSFIHKQYLFTGSTSVWQTQKMAYTQPLSKHHWRAGLSQMREFVQHTNPHSEDLFSSLGNLTLTIILLKGKN